MPIHVDEDCRPGRKLSDPPSYTLIIRSLFVVVVPFDTDTGPVLLNPCPVCPADYARPLPPDGGRRLERSG